MMNEIAAVLENYDVGELISSVQIPTGIVNVTYEITTSKGRFVLQKVHHLWDERIIDDYRELQRLLDGKVKIPKLIAARNGKFSIRHNGELWRLLEYIEHDHDVKPTPDLIAKAAHVLAKLHKELAKTDFEPTFKLKDFHVTRNIIAKMHRLVKEHAAEAKHIENEYRFIASHIEKHYLPLDAPTTVIHGDPKFANFLFKDNEVVAMIDFDTIMRASYLVDVGDGLRSWCKTEKGFDEQIFNAAVKSYDVERNTARNALGLITLELAARFLNDYFEQSYFQWDRNKFRSSAEFNLFKCRSQIEYYKEFA